MKLLTKELEKKMPGYRGQERIDNPNDPVVYAVFFHPLSSWYWFVTEYNSERKEFFGFVCGNENEFGYFSLKELESVSVMGLGIERDLYFEPKRLSKVIEDYKGLTISDRFPDWLVD